MFHNQIKNSFPGVIVPEKIQNILATICSVYNLSELSDSCFIANVIAKELNKGNGNGKFYHPKVAAAIEVFSTNYFCHAELDAQLAIEYCEAIDEILLTKSTDFFPYVGISFTQLIRDINKLIPPMDIAFNKSNNDKIHHKFIVGREGVVSPVLYLKIAKYYIINHNWKQLEYDLTFLAAENYGCDEYGVTENNDSCFQYRFWWDYSQI